MDRIEAWVEAERRYAAAESRIDWDDPRSYEAAEGELERLHAELMDAQAWTMYRTCTGHPVLIVEGNADIADSVAAALDLGIHESCGTCGDYSIGAAETPAGPMPDVDCQVVRFDEIEQVLAGAAE